jgi:hypothetical protein
MMDCDNLQTDQLFILLSRHNILINFFICHFNSQVNDLPIFGQRMMKLNWEFEK